MPDLKVDPSPEAKQPAAELLPVLYAELRRLAAALTARLGPARPSSRRPWSTRRICAWCGTRIPAGRAGAISSARRPRAMREILIEQARRKGSRKHGGGARRVELAEGLAWIEPPADDLLALDEAIQQLQAEEPHLAEIVLLRYYTGLSVEETAGVLGSASTLCATGALPAPGWPGG